ncbi:MAG: hypothetical protein E3J22_08845 [Candidatus Aminicenantes bacterium]|nr:MAG: hypothetical protein E3J22_08845 [Candidatus Aminicenantes bacterium]
MRPFLAIAMIVLLCTVSFAQEKYIELLRQDIKKDKVEIITVVMDFTEEQVGIFWPIYREYDLELTKIGDERLAMIKDYAEHYQTLTDEKAKELMEKVFQLQQKRVKLRRAYFKKMDKVLPSKVVAKFFQLEHQIILLLDLQIASELPLIDEWIN